MLKNKIAMVFAAALLFANAQAMEWSFYLGGEALYHMGTTEKGLTEEDYDGFAYAPKGTFVFQFTDFALSVGGGYRFGEYETETTAVTSNYEGAFIEIAPRFRLGGFQVGPMIEAFFSKDLASPILIEREEVAGYAGISALYDFDLGGVSLAAGLKAVTDVTLHDFQSTLVGLDLKLGIPLFTSGVKTPVVETPVVNVPVPAPVVAAPEPIVDQSITSEGTTVNLSLGEGRIKFASGKWNLNSTATSFLDTLAGALSSNSNLFGSVIVNGHTDKMGKDTYNTWLSNKRANSVKDYLVSRGVSSSQIDAMGWGEEQLLDMGNSRDSHAANRRVDISLKDVTDINQVKLLLNSIL